MATIDNLKSLVDRYQTAKVNGSLDKEIKGLTIDEIVSTYYLLHDSFEDSHEKDDVRYLQIDFGDFIAYVDVNSDNTVVSLHFDAVQVMDEDTMLYKPLYFEKELRQLA